MRTFDDTATPPFLKWAGGKRWLLPELQKHLPSNYNRYIEPFLGGGSVFFALRPNKSLLSDLNHELIQLYKVVRDRPEELLSLLEKHHKNHNKEYYYSVRSFVPTEVVDKAARTLYLNRTCFNGLYRVNQKGCFNVPIGTKTTVVFPGETFDAASRLLRNSVLITSDFEDIILQASSGDLLYIDPPYTVVHNMNGFLKYNNNIFSWDDQIRLRNCIEDAACRGVYILASNANHDSIKELYFNRGEHLEVSRFSGIAGSSTKRAQTTELLLKFNL